MHSICSWRSCGAGALSAYAPLPWRLLRNPTQQPVVSDIALDNGGTLHGQLIDLQGGNVSGIPVTLQSQSHEVVATTTTADGSFTAQNVKGGRVSCRRWPEPG